MNNEWVFRVALVVGLLTLLSVVLPYRLRARTGERLDRRQEGLALAITLRLVGLGYWLGLLCYIIRPEWMAWGAVPLPAAVRWMGAPLRRHGDLSDRLDAAPPGSKPYGHRGDAPAAHADYFRSVSLHPPSVLRQRGAGVSWPIRCSRPTSSCCVTGGMGFGLLINRTGREEANLVARFGDEYRRYQERTGRVLPKLTR